MLERTARLTDETARLLADEAAAPAAGGPRRLRVFLEVRPAISPIADLLILLAAVAVGVALSAGILIAAGVPPGDLYYEFLVATLTDPQNLSAVMVRAAPLILVGVAAAIAFRVRFWNIGLEGQIIFGGIAAVLVGLGEVGPPAVRLALMLAAALLAGAAWVVLPLVLKLKIGVNEIISTLLLNYVAVNVLLHLIYGPLQDKIDNFPHSPELPAGSRLPLIGWEKLDAGLPLALAVAFIVFWVVRMSRGGLYMRFIHANDRMALAVGVPITLVTAATVLASGALSGAAGFLLVAGQEYRLTPSFFGGYGLSGILIAFLARSNPLGATVAAVLVALLFTAGQSLQVFFQIPSSAVQLIQALIVLVVAASEFFVRHRIRFARTGGAR